MTPSRSPTVAMILAFVLATPLKVAAQNGIPSAPPVRDDNFLSIATSEKALVTLGLLVPPEEAVAMGLGPIAHVALLFDDQDGNPLGDSADPPTLMIPREGFRTATISAECLSKNTECNLIVETPDGTQQVYHAALKPLHDRVIVRMGVGCATAPCGRGVSGLITVVDERTAVTRSAKSFHWILNQPSSGAP